MKRRCFRKALSMVLVLSMAFSIGTATVFADNQPHKWVIGDWFESLGPWGEAVQDPQDSNITILFGSATPEEGYPDIFPGPFSKIEGKGEKTKGYENLDLSNGKMIREIHMLIGPGVLKGGILGVTAALNDSAGNYLTEMRAEFSIYGAEPPNISYYAAGEGKKCEITKDAIYTVRWEYWCDSAGKVYGKQFLITGGEVVGETTSGLPLKDLGSKTAAEQVTARYMWFYNIHEKIDSGVKVYTKLPEGPKPPEPPEPPEPPAPSKVVSVTSLVMPQWTTESLTEKLADFYKTDNTVKWSSSDQSVVSVDAKNKLMTTLNTGSVMLTAKSDNGKSGSIAITVTPQILSGVKAKPGKKKMTISWLRNSMASGYVVAYSRKPTSGFKVKTTYSLKTTIKNLKKKKVYYVKVCPFQVFNGKKCYGSYSNLIRVKVK